MSYYVYEMVDTQIDQPFYVGITRVNPTVRLRQHLGLYYGSREKNVKIQQLLDDQADIPIRIIEEVEEEDQAREREKFWIRDYTERGFKLYNAQHIPLQSKIQAQREISQEAINTSSELDRIRPFLQFRTHGKDYGVDYPEQLPLSPRYEEYLDDSFADYLDTIFLQRIDETQDVDIHVELEYFMLVQGNNNRLMAWYHKQIQNKA